MSRVKKVGSNVYWVVAFAAVFAGLCLTGCSSSGGGETRSVSVALPSSGSILKFFDPVATPLGMNFISTAYAASTLTGVKSPNNGLFEGEQVVISGTTNYNGTYTAHICPTASPDTFCIDHPYTADDATGTWQKTAGIAGVCGSANGTAVATAPNANLCTTSGTTPTVSGAGPFTWVCTGSNGGADTNCSAPLLTAVNGVCGSANLTQVSSAPATNLCTATATTPTVQSSSSSFTWICTGSNGGTDIGCLAYLMQDGACGSANGTQVSLAPATGLCTTGTSSTVTGSGPFNWTCAGSYGGATASCSASLLLTPVNGVCGSANGATVTSAPTSNLCTATGTTPSVTGTGPFAWSCTGSNGGTTASCSASLPPPVNGVCGSADGTIVTSTPTTNLCSTSGTTPTVTGSGPFNWSCTGRNGGINASCTALLKQDGVCGTANAVSTLSAPTTNLCTTSGTTPSVAGSGPFNWSCTGSNGGIDASCSAPLCVSTGNTSAITLPSGLTIPSRFSGVAPLAVFFDATGTTATATTKPFHELEYRWNFSETTGPGIGTWSNGSRAGISSRNSATGPVAAHVFETPGTYTLNLTATDGTNTVSNSCVHIAVQDPNVIFAGTNTICVASGAAPIAGVDGCPAGAEVHGSATFDTIMSTYVATGKRVLLKHDDTFTLTATSAGIAVNGPGILGMYGSGAKPIISPANINATDILQLSAVNKTPNISDWRIMDLQFVKGSAGTSLNAIDTKSGVDNFTLLRLDTSGIPNRSFLVNDFALVGVAGTTLYDGIFIQDCSTFGSYSSYFTAQRSAIMGNSFNNNGDPELALRVQYGYKVVIANNTLQGQSATKQALSVRANLQGSAVAAKDANGGVTQYVEIADNKFIGNAADGYTMAVQPQGNELDLIQDIIFERNWVIGGSGSAFLAVLNAPRESIRNNVFDTSLTTFHNALVVSSNASYPSATWTDTAWVYNNTFYDSAAAVTAIRIDANSSNVTVKNNLAYSASGGTMISGTGTGTFTQSNNTGTITSSPGFANTSNPAIAGFFKPTTGNTIGGGTSVPVWSDFFLFAEPSPYDIGAVVH